MPSEEDHLKLATHNRETIEFLCTERDRFPDWITTVAFYTSLHLVDALLAHDSGSHGRDHRQRSRILKRENRYKAICKAHQMLYEASCVARYLSDGDGEYKTFEDYMTAEDVETIILKDRLPAVERSVAALLRPQVAKKRRNKKGSR